MALFLSAVLNISRCNGIAGAEAVFAMAAAAFLIADNCWGKMD
jgi:hypothetical protein